MPQLKLRKINKGWVTYGLEGIRPSVYFSKSMFPGEPPQELPVSYDGFVPPGAVKTPSIPKSPTPEQVEKARLAAEKAEARAKTATERAEKARARAAKYTQAQPQEPVTA